MQQLLRLRFEFGKVDFSELFFHFSVDRESAFGLKDFVHFSDCEDVEPLELGVQDVDDLLDRRVGHHVVERSAAEILFAVRTRDRSFLAEVESNSAFAESVAALDDCVCVSEKPFAQVSREVGVELVFVDRVEQVVNVLGFLRVAFDRLSVVFDYYMLTINGSKLK